MPNELRPPAHVLRRLPREHPVHQRYLALPKDDPRRIAYDAEFPEEEQEEPRRP
jgi:hypothetical protein